MINTPIKFEHILRSHLEKVWNISSIPDNFSYFNYHLLTCKNVSLSNHVEPSVHQSPYSLHSQIQSTNI